MKILYINRRDCYTKPGGDTVQMEKTKFYLEKLGVSIDVITEGDPDFSKYDLVHIFNIQNYAHSLKYIRSAKSVKIKTLVSTIYWNLDALYKEDFYTNPRFSLPRTILPHPLSEFVLNKYLHRIRQKQRMILTLADILLPNSQTEADKLIEDFSLPKTTVIMPVPNAVDRTDFTNLDPAEFKKKYSLDHYVACVARIQSAKNQLNLIRATKKLGLHLVLIGNTSEESYSIACKKEAVGGKVTFLPFMPHGEIKNALAGALCHALPSLRETPGLSSLEAAMCACPVVSGTEGSQYEYFNDYAYYCNPRDVNSIAHAIQQSMQMPIGRRREFKSYIEKHFVWEITAQKTRTAYETLLTR